MVFTFALADGHHLIGRLTVEEEKALNLFCSVQEKTVEEYLKDIFSSAVQTAVNMINYAGCAEIVKSVLDRQGGAK